MGPERPCASCGLLREWVSATHASVQAFTNAPRAMNFPTSEDCLLLGLQQHRHRRLAIGIELTVAAEQWQDNTEIATEVIIERGLLFGSEALAERTVLKRPKAMEHVKCSLSTSPDEASEGSETRLSVAAWGSRQA
eukprot:6209079-Pleurochrysis_carterae.AAC.6